MTDRRWHGGSLLYELKDEGRSDRKKTSLGFSGTIVASPYVHPRIAPGKGHGRRGRGQEDGHGGGRENG